jgi:hypothetical protein
MNTIIAAIVVMLVLGSLSCNQKTSTQAVEQLSSSAMDRDYSMTLANTQELAKSTGPTSQNHYINLNWKNTATEALSAKLSPEERKQLIGWEAPNGERANLFLALMSYRLFEEATGQAPKSGKELMTWAFRNLPNEEIERFDSLGPEALPIGFYQFVNPHTGRLYESFDGSAVEPGGVRFHVLESLEDAKRAFDGRPGWDRFELNKTGWEIVVMDHSGKKVLDTAVVLQTNSAPPIHGDHHGVRERNQPVSDTEQSQHPGVGSSDQSDHSHGP